MLARPVAWLLIALVALPFTAPFSTCDVSMLLAGSSVRVPSLVERVERSTIESGTRPMSGSILEEEQFKDATLTTVTVATHTYVEAVWYTVIAPRPSVSRSPLVTLRL